MSYQSHHHKSFSGGSSQDFDASIPPATRKDTIHLTPYSRPPLYNPSDYAHGPYQSWSGEDPRTSSTQSLLPDYLPGDGRRTLLLVYIHGFMGNDTSFQKFPAHVHNLLTIALIETHVIHSKIYPRYKSRGTIESAAVDFSHWLSPHESPETDVILLGHSLGGILAAEVALLKSAAPGSQEVQRHRILGTLSFDTPFLGMHPSVVTTGIGSLFQRKQKTETPQQDGSSTQSSAVQTVSDTLASTGLNDSSPSPFALPTNDPNYDPAFSNDVRLPQRSQLDGAIHFISKYSDRLAHATRQYVTSHVEFGSCLADYPGLKRRYRAIRELDDIDDCNQSLGPDGRRLRRVRFANYYTASTGRLKPPPLPPRNLPQTSQIPDNTRSQENLSQTNTPNSFSETSKSPAADFVGGALESEHSNLESNKYLDSKTTSEFTLEVTPDITQDTMPPAYVQDVSTPQPDGILPPIPPPPADVPPFDPAPYDTKAEQKEAQKEHSQMVKSYEKAKKERDKAIRNREKAAAKLEKAAAKEQRQQAKEQNRSTVTELPPSEDQNTLASSESLGGEAPTRSAQPTTPKKDRKFCALPPKDTNGVRDPLWIRVHMKGMDEVVAHQSLFFPGESYERLVGDVSAQIEQWVNDDATTRMIMTEMEDVKA
ncbi:hypothetical protein FQN54_003564 [Arachnomyces sp. PD_36]|nr:hypothetical protein FQN54_003564 [Arachnomyces sp. PD_36]